MAQHGSDPNTPPASALPACLAGVRVVELGQFLAGPFGGMILADLGAEVVKVEFPGRGDDGRRMGKAFAGGDALIFRDINRGKKSVALDFKSPEGRERLLGLIGSADVVISNLRPGTVQAHGIDGPALVAMFPRLVYCDLAAFGHQGPLREQPGFEPLAQAYSGLSSVNGHADGPATRTGPSVVDLGSGMWIALSALAALRRRDRSGQGAVVKLSLLETALAWIAADVSGYLNEGREPVRRGNGQPLLTPYDVFQASDGPICLAVGNDAQFQRLASVLGFPDWAQDPELASNAARLAHKARLVDAVAQALAGHTRAHWSALLQAAGVPCSVVNSIPEALATPQVGALGMVRVSPLTQRSTVSLPFTIDGLRPGSDADSPALGAHNAEILRS